VLLVVAEEKFKIALNSKPDDPAILAHWGILLLQVKKEERKRGRENEKERERWIEKGEGREEEASVLLVVAEEKFKIALNSKPDDPAILAHWGILLLQVIYLERKRREGLGKSWN
jgi:hypothetical protein